MLNRSNLFEPLKSKRTFEQIADQMRQLIYSGTFKPGDRLMSERELANQFRTGRMVVREALRTLENSGLIRIKQGSSGGVFINDANTKVITRSISDMIKIGNVTLRELIETRLEIEMIILNFAIARINPEDLDLLKKNIEDSEQQILAGIRPLETNLNFHLLLAKASKNTLFEMIIESIMEVSKIFLQSVKPEKEYINKVLYYHKEIYKAIKEKNLIIAEEKMREHLLGDNLLLLHVSECGVNKRE
jgi:DNA-binding FadR family transcriptional regulator